MMKELIGKLQRGEHLTRAEAKDAFGRIMAGAVDGPTLGAFLCALASKGEVVDELVGAAQAMRSAATRVRCDRPCMCTCGTGGDGISTFNVSTTAAIIASAAGAVVAKHGNRTNTRVSGSAEVLASLGVNIEADVPVLERCLAECGLAFLYAPRLHPAMKHAVPVRRAIRSRTIFNLLGPLCNPAGACRQVLGVSRPAHVQLMAEALRELGAERAWVVHGGDGLCDLTITGPTHVAELADGKITTRSVRPADAGLAEATLDALIVASAEESAAAVGDILDGTGGPRRDHALLNAAAALVVYGVTNDLRDGVARAADAVDSGAARAALERLARLTCASA
ncbi:MAG TPA: anthranilate phosphoribosyltransferase [Phycisphaerae bacterium]|nr:anthranilate phosphoribosyltransferase [Phycisphaerales bacterium]HRX85357.1 anthranilate phosphoribosyltransferase [Phycisphaerae bacterium]